MKIKIYYVIVCILLISCTSQRNLKNTKNDLAEEEYLSYFTDATRQALVFGNFRDAIQLYNKCISIFDDRAAPYYQLSNIYFSINDIKTGKFYAKTAYELDSSNTWYILHLANVYQYENNLDSVIILYERLVKLSDDLENKYNLSIFYSQKGDIKNSMRILGDIEKQIAGSKELLMMKYQNYKAMSMSDSALSQLECLVKIFPDSYENMGLLAEYLCEINRFGYADSVYKHMIKEFPDKGLANISYADYFMRLNLKDSALVYYEKGFKTDDIKIDDKLGVLFNLLYNPILLSGDSIVIPKLVETLKSKYNDPRPYTIAAEYYVKKLKYDSAVNELKSAIDIGSDNYVVWEQYIMLCNYLNRHQQVYDIYDEAIKKFSDRIKIYIYSGYSLFELEKFNEIISLCNKALSINNLLVEDKVQILNLLADTYRKTNDNEKSDSTFEEILKIDYENLLVRNNYSYYLSLRSKNLERARELSYYTIKVESDNSTYLDTYGWILFKMGNSKDAIKYIEAAIKNGAYNNSEVLDHYGDIMFSLKRYSEAKEAWLEAIKYSKFSTIEIENKIKDVDSNYLK